MHPDDPQWETYQTRFEALAERAEEVPRSHQVASAQMILTLFGDNGMSPEEEFAYLDALEQHPGPLKKVLVDYDYWQNTVLFIPETTSVPS